MLEATPPCINAIQYNQFIQRMDIMKTRTRHPSNSCHTKGNLIIPEEAAAIIVFSNEVAAVSPETDGG
jgi:hypothetical protein